MSKLHGATLNGLVNPMGAVTTVTFEYGIDTTYGTVVVLPDAISGKVALPVSINITELDADTLYHFRVKASNISGESIGEDLTFTTMVDLPEVTTLAATNIS